MIQTQTLLKVADNSGAAIVKCIGMLGKNRSATVGRVISVSIKKLAESGNAITSVKGAAVSTSGGSPTALLKQGDVYRALVVRTKKPVMRPDGRRVSFGDNAAVLLNRDFTPVGTRIRGPIAEELKAAGGGTAWAKILALAQRVI
ncbi:hypothetical protein MDAP_000492 [Mitosporidium daphniae]|uniref:Ribosomal protein L14 n=1 Tax=Mitosporidium daphniae TaxID=1485682 RepID=A0A098VV38_9MICR|nr:ribosomal protein L14 [Mitosporidium daphniae]KGG51586.1 ribosomal protein L14 [Mitosporidium daphniae]|eukprot:XP_013238044.1 ribosomal protein L14 [Mitosporidium daphniae]